MISADTAAAFERFSSTVKRAVKARSKDVRLEIADANLLMTEIANVLAKLVVHENAVATANANVTVRMDGGGLAKDK